MRRPSATTAPLHIDSVTARFVRVPMRFALGTSAATVTHAPLLLVDLRTREGLVGNAYLFCYRDSGARAIAAVVDEAVGLLKGQPAAPLGVAALLARRYALLGVAGIARMALAAIDIALWDLQGKAAGLPLARLLGGSHAPISAYNSDGLGLMPAAKAAKEAVALLEAGFDAVKLRLGHDDAATDLKVARAVRRAIGDARLMIDYNQALTVPEAIKRARDLEGLDAYWLEEQIRHGDLRGYAELSTRLDVPVQLGENLDGPEAVHDAVAAGAADYLMLDAARVGGVTGWLRGAAIAHARGIPVSSHLFPEISVHLLAATPGAHWLEYVSWADAILEEPMVVRNGHAAPPDRPGLGLAWNEKGVKKYLVA